MGGILRDPPAPGDPGGLAEWRRLWPRAVGGVKSYPSGGDEFNAVFSLSPYREGDPLLPTRLHLCPELWQGEGIRRGIPFDIPVFLLRDRPVQREVG